MSVLMSDPGERIALPLQVGDHVIDPPVVLAPMAGITNRAFRRLCRESGAGLYVSEMTTSRALVERNGATMDMVSFAEDEYPRSVQLYGVDPQVMAAAVRIIVSEDRADHIDLNFGASIKCQLSTYTSAFLGYNYKYGLSEDEKETEQGYNINAHMVNIGFSYAIAGLKKKQKEYDYQKQIKRLKSQLATKQDADEANENCLAHLPKNTSKDSPTYQEMKDYVDEVMSKRIESLGTNSMFNSLVVLFPSNSSNYYPASQIDLNNLLKALKSKKYSQVNITGYADMSGNKDVNLSLSKSRANKVSEFLINNGVDPKVIKTEYWGETSQFDKSNLVNNRRVEINIEY